MINDSHPRLRTPAERKQDKVTNTIKGVIYCCLLNLTILVYFIWYNIKSYLVYRYFFQYIKAGIKLLKKYSQFKWLFNQSMIYNDFSIKIWFYRLFFWPNKRHFWPNKRHFSPNQRPFFTEPKTLFHRTERLFPGFWIKTSL